MFFTRGRRRPPGNSVVFIAILLFICLSAAACQDKRPAPDQPDETDSVVNAPEPIELPLVSPSETVGRYWAYLNDRDFSNGWQLLESSYRERNYRGDYASYAQSFNRMNLCGAQLIAVQKEVIEENAASVVAEVVLERGSECREERFQYDLILKRRTPDAPWRIRRVQIKQ